MRGFKISFNISNYIRHHQSLHPTTRHVVESPFMMMLTFFSSSSSYNNNNSRSNDGYSGGRPPPRRRSGDSPSSSRLSGFIDDNDSCGGRDFRGRQHPNPNYSNQRIRPRSNNLSNSNASYVPFDYDDDEQNPQISHVNPNSRVKDNKLQDVDGFLDRFKLGFDQDNNNNNNNHNKPNSEKLNSGGDGELASSPAPPEDADEIFRKMKETGLIPNAVAMLHGLCSDGLVQDALKLFGVMRERGSIPEVVIYTAVVEGFCKAHKPDEAIRIFRKMQSNGIVPNAFSYGVLVQGLINGKQLDDVLEFCLEMVEAGHSPNLATFTGLVNVFCKERGLEAAQIVIGKLKDKGFGFDDKGVRDFMEKKGPFSPVVWEAIFGKTGSKMF
ncbi:uncharacterized protein LOC143530896 [Bidens hawaiensis]|uniref:uncharacterized protein LOC143530888 n=1 Tax=Bidens hawaiensis TaxID=980011 RepID=UPI00404ABA02